MSSPPSSSSTSVPASQPASMASQNSSFVSIIDDPLSPYYIHHSDSPELNLVSQPLTRDNYASWSRAMTIAFSVKNKLGFIDGSIGRPVGTDLHLLNS